MVHLHFNMCLPLCQNSLFPSNINFMVYFLISTMKVIEYVANPAEFCKSISALTIPNGATIISTINRSMRAYASAIVAAEYNSTFDTEANIFVSSEENNGGEAEPASSEKDIDAETSMVADDSDNGGDSIYGGVFAGEFHSRLRFNNRGIVALANASLSNSNGSQFFFYFG